MSVPFADDEVGRAIEPHATLVSQRLKALEVLSEAGITTGVAIAPIIPGLNDSAIPEILERAADAGVDHAFYTLLRLPGSVEAVFTERLRAHFPDRADRVLNTLREMRGGEVNTTEFGDRMSGEGPRWEIVASLFETHCRKMGLNETERGEVEELDGPGKVQPSLFGE
jgi:DNA repair photolyase